MTRETIGVMVLALVALGWFREAAARAGAIPAVVIPRDEPVLTAWRSGQDGAMFLV